MEPKLVNYKLNDGIAIIEMDDGDKNLISLKMLTALNKALNQAKRDDAIVIITGREKVFSAGFDLKVLKTGAMNAFKMVIGGFVLSKRLLSFPRPVIIACSGHAVAMGAFLLLSGDYRLGVEGPFKIVANEVLIGLTMPYAAVELLKQRPNPAYYIRSTILSEEHNPETAVKAGFLDELVAQNDLMDKSFELATQFKKLDRKSHYQSKLRARKTILKRLKRAIIKDRINFILLGIKGLISKRFGSKKKKG